MTSHLTLDHLLWRMRHVHPGSEVTVVEDPIDPAASRRHTFAEMADRVEALAHGLRGTLGLRTGGVITVLGWNDIEHFEMLLAVPIAGGTLNNVNLRLGVTNMALLAQNPAPLAIVFSAALLDHPSVGAEVREVADAARAAGTQIVIAGDATRSVYPEAIAYEDLIREYLGAVWNPIVTDEVTPAYLFHTSGTTGTPKTYQVTHRSAILHCLSQSTVEATGISSRDRVLPLAPFFHVNGWGLPLTCAMTGASLVLAGGDLRPARIAHLMETENVTVAAAVPTVWYSVCAAIEAGEAPKPSALREILTGGDALAKSIWQSIQSVLGVRVATAWGMTETMACSTYERQRPYERAGKPIPLVELQLESVTDSHEVAAGRLRIRGPFTIGDSSDSGDWFSTGDIASIDETGVLTLRDREKDLIKSGGEWIASAELEQRLCAHPIVAAAAVVPTSDPRWVQRPVAYVVLKPGVLPDSEVFAPLTEHLAETFPRWWLPDDIRVIDSLPVTTVGKVNKRALRELAETTQERGTNLVE